MKINVNSNGSVKVVTDKIEFGSLYLNGSYEFDATYGSINASIVMDKKDYEGSELEGAINASLQVSYEQALKKNPKLKAQITKVEKVVPEYDDNGDETGRVLIKLKQKCKFEKDGQLVDRAFPVVDGHRNPVTNYTELTAGTLGKVCFTILPYYMSANKQAGVSLWMNSIQVLDPKFYEGGSDFEDEEDGWEAPKSVAQLETEVRDESINAMLDDKPVDIAKSIDNDDDIMDMLDELDKK